MQGVKPCPYCGGEVEMVKLGKKKNEKIKGDIYRIQCYKCHALVARGQGFPIETLSDAEERIRDYKTFMNNQLAPISPCHFPISAEQYRKDYHAARSFMRGPDDEVNDIHDANQCNKNRGGWR